MRICIVSEHYFPKLGGTTTHTHEITKNLAKIDPSNLIYLITSSEQEYKNRIKQKNIKCEFIQIPKFLQRENFISVFLSLKLLKICLKEKIDIIHVTYGFFSIIFATIIAKLLRIKVIFTIQNVPPEEHSKSKNKFFQNIYHKIVKIFGYFVLNLPFNKLICVSKQTACLAKCRGVKINKITIIPNGISDIFFEKLNKETIRSKFKIQKNEIILLNVAGIISHKGQEFLIKAFSKINQIIPNSTLFLIGPIRDNKYFLKLKNSIEFQQNSKKIYFLGGKKYFHLPEYYKMADIYVQPSLQEGFCISILEAMASSLPVIGTNVGVIPEIIGSNERGILIKILNLTNLETQILKLIKNENLRTKYAESGAIFAKTYFLWKNIAKKTKNLYDNLI
ncbi:MAG: glycosyltransferase family 4 protein [Promethearchaeota archaeon]